MDDDGRYSAEVWRRLLMLVDGELSSPARLDLIGGGALALQYAPKYVTRDLDTISTAGGELSGALERAQQRIQEQDGLRRAPPVSYASVYDAPYTFEERCKPLELEGLRYLQVIIPEVHDLALMKTARGEEKDFEALEALHRERPLDLGTLTERYAEMMFVGPQERLRGNFVGLVDRLYGERTARALEPQLERLDRDRERGLATVRDWRGAALEARWSAAVGDEFSAVRSKATRVEQRAGGQVERQRSRLLEHDQARPREPRGLGGLLGGRERHAERMAAWDRDGSALKRRLNQLNRRVETARAFGREPALGHPTKGSQLAERRATARDPYLAREAQEFQDWKRDHGPLEREARQTHEKDRNGGRTR